MLLSGPISLICFKLANSIFMPQACYFPLPSFYFTGSPSLIAMEYPEGEKKGRAKHSAISPAWKRLKSLEGCRKTQCEHNKQQQPRKLNPSEKSASWEPLCNWRGSIYLNGQCPAQYKPCGYRTRVETPPNITSLIPPELTSTSPSLKSSLPLK